METGDATTTLTNADLSKMPPQHSKNTLLSSFGDKHHMVLTTQVSELKIDEISVDHRITHAPIA